jgi:hypothetical protein
VREEEGGVKYVVLQRQHCGLPQDVPVIFPDYLIHAQVAAVIGALPGMEKAKPVSAGSLASFGIDAEPLGFSESLNLAAREEDGAIIKMHDYLCGH